MFMEYCFSICFNVLYIVTDVSKEGIACINQEGGDDIFVVNVGNGKRVKPTLILSPRNLNDGAKLGTR
jgi:hypothetical protein